MSKRLYSSRETIIRTRRFRPRRNPVDFALNILVALVAVAILGAVFFRLFA